MIEWINSNGIAAVMALWALTALVDAMPKRGEGGAPDVWWYGWIRKSLVAFTGQFRSAVQRQDKQST